MDAADEDEEEDEEVQEVRTLAVDPLRMGSIGCKEEERWKR